MGESKITRKNVPVLTEPTAEELAALEKFDPNHMRYVEFK